MNIVFETIASVSITRRPQDFNSSNHHSYSPYYVVYDEHQIPTLVILRYFYEKYLTLGTKIKLKDQNFKLVDEVEVDGIRNLSDDIFLWMYKTFNAQYHFDAYYDELSEFLPQCCIIRLTLEQKINLSKIRNNSLDEQIDLLDTTLKRSLEKAILSFSGKPLFVKLSNTSAKNDQPISPFTSLKDIVKFLCSLRECQKRLNDIVDVSIIIMPFNDMITKENEFRVFVQEKAIRAICPQNWSSIQYFSIDQVCDIVTLVESLLSRIFETDFGLHSGVFDVFLLNGEAHLIEINPWGCFASSGSSLFHWLKDDLDSFSNKTPPPNKNEQPTLFRNVDLYNHKTTINHN